MFIYLARVGVRPGGSLYLDRTPHGTTEHDYIAISHVWGTPETIQPTEIDGIPGFVPLSPGKKDILSILRRPEICGDGWFWMDLFCIDQTESASISITDQLMAIPSIYKSSRCVKVLLEKPVCRDWQETARQVYEKGAIDEEVFAEEELAHGRKCPHLLFGDPWFERLWTRQEGLYAFVLDFVILNPVPCERPRRSKHVDGKAAWVSHGSLLAQRTILKSYLHDKLSYHGILPTTAEGALFSIYFDVVYKHHLSMLAYNADAGPAPTYSPIREAWRSGRSTTKERDYVLAVFPDIDGYKVPPKARHMSYSDLLHDAILQLAIRGHLRIAPKVPRGMMISSGKSTLPWIIDKPSSIGEAYDTFTASMEDRGNIAEESKLFLIADDIGLEEVHFTSSCAGIKDDWMRTADILKHMVFVSPSGPCTGTTRVHIDSTSGLLHQYFFQKFAAVAVSQYLPKGKLEALELRTKGVISFDPCPDVPRDIFEHELRRFIVCMVCGTSLGTADKILQAADIVRVSTPYGVLLGLVHTATRLQAKSGSLVLMCGSASFMEGFLICCRVGGGISVIGRTVIPNRSIWDAVAGGAGVEGN
ncbi:hypothetical protein K438DRAFT_1777458 [Mycena galopus ATCC 62051]|nr:hypothetical protein K438DRAFT_1777458 [Mycena galopus ATCC 62051]